MREAIERAALELALEQGYDSTTVEEIAERAEVATRTVYVQYGTKDAILLGTPESAAASFAAWLSEFDAWVEGAEGELVDRLVRYVEQRLEMAGELGLLRRRAIYGDPFLRRAMRGRNDELETLLAARFARHAGVPDDDVGARVAAAAAVALMAAIAYGGADPEVSTPDFGRGVHVLRAALEALRA